MDKAKIWFMDARANRFLESTAIKGRQILEHSGWLDNLNPGDIVAVKTHMGEAYNVGYLRPVIVRTLVEALKERGCRLDQQDPCHRSSRDCKQEWLQPGNHGLPCHHC